MTEESHGLSQRLSGAVKAAVYNVALWILVPYLISENIAASLPSSPIAFGTTFIYSFGITITALQVVGALTSGMAVSIPFLSGSYVAEAYFIWAAAEGGTLAFSAQGVGITLAFQPLLFLLMVPSLFAAVKSPLTYLLEHHEAALPSPDVV